jgi:hypothetical protein
LKMRRAGRRSHDAHGARDPCEGRDMADEEQKANTRDENGKFVPGYKPPTAWDKGESGNPNGRPPNEGSITYWLKVLLAEPNGGGLPVAKTVAAKVIAQAKKGNLKAVSEILDRTEGKAKQSMEVTGKDGKDLIPDAAAALDAKLAGIAATITAADGADDTDG